MPTPPNAPIVNLNGASRASLIAQQEKVIFRATELLRALEEAMPHGRDYQLNPDDLQVARRRFTRQHAEVQAVLQHAEDMVGYLMDGEG